MNGAHTDRAQRETQSFRNKLWKVCSPLANMDGRDNSVKCVRNKNTSTKDPKTERSEGKNDGTDILLLTFISDVLLCPFVK